MIKFRCPSCDQKLGVPDEYAGKRVRCSKCSQACQVPAAAAPESPQTVKPVNVPAPAAAAVRQPASAPAIQRQSQAALRPQPAPVPPPPADVNPNPDVDDNPFGNLDLDSLTGGPDSEALAAARQARHKQHAKSVRGSTRSSGPSAGAVSAAGGLALGAGKIPLSLAASLGFMIGVCIIWTVIAYITGWIFVYFAVAVAAAGAYGLVMFTEKRNAGLGLLAIGMALVGILIGKGMIARWVVMPQIMDVINSGDFDSQAQPFSSLPSEQQQEILESNFFSFAIGATDLWQQEQFDESVAQTLILENISRGDIQDEYETTIEDAVSEYPDEHEAVCAHIDNWTPQQKREAFEKNYQTYMASAFNWIKNSSFMKGIGFAAAFVGAFSLWDLLMLPLSLITAWKIGSGSNS